MQESTDNATFELAKAVVVLQQGGVVAFPTETVYGLGASIAQEEAVARVFALKRRPPTHPLIVHIASSEQLEIYARDVTKTAKLLAKHFWPGPLTLILPKSSQVPANVTGGQDTVALRVPQHPLALELLRQVGTGLVGPSANMFGRLSPTMPQHVTAQFGAKVMVLDGGNCVCGIESTIVSLVGAEPIILRQGVIDAQQISQVLGKTIAVQTKPKSGMTTPGSLTEHYCPRTPLWLVSADSMEIMQQLSKTKKIGYLGHKLNFPVTHFILAAKNNSEYAEQLYKNLHTLDNLALDLICVAKPPSDISWGAINERLQKASKGVLLESLVDNS